MMRNGGLMVFVLGWVIAGGAMAAAPDRHVVVISVDGLPGSFLDDPKASIPNIRALRDKGVGAKRGMTVSNPSVTWPNHTTLMTGVYPDQHGVIYNGRAVRGGVNQPTKVISASSQAELVRIPLLFDILKEAGQTSAAIYWPCTRESQSLLVNFPDVPNSLQYTTESLKAKLTELPRYSVPDTNGAVYDEVWTEATCRTILDDKPNLVALHLLVVDGTHHDFGPNTNAGYTAVALADANVGRVLAAIDRAGIADSTDVFIVSDHGFTTVPQSIRPNAILRREGLLEADGKKITSCRVQVVPEGGIGMVYLTDPATRDADRATFHRLFDKAEGVAQIIDPSDYSQYHFPDPADHAGMADMVIASRDGYAVSGSPVGDDFVGPNDGNIGSHGFLSTEPKMVALFVAAGPNIQPGAPLDQIANVDVAPTIARLLNVTLNPVAGRPLTEILRPSSARD